MLTVALQSDGGVLVGGLFSTLGGGGTGLTARSFLGRLYPDGSLDQDFVADTDFDVYALARQPDGKIVVGGLFSTLGGLARSSIGRVYADGTVDVGFNPDILGLVTTLAIQPDGKILVGGNFAFVGPVPCNNIARLNAADGSVDTCFGDGADFMVDTIALQADGKILVGGLFSTLDGVLRDYIGRFNADGTVDSFNPLVDDEVSKLAIQQDGRILAAGFFSLLDGQPRNFIGRLEPNGTLDPLFNPTPDGPVADVVEQPDGRILMVGAFNAVDGGTTRNFIARVEAADGAADPLFDPDLDDCAQTIALQTDGKIVIGGCFTMVGGAVRNGIARLNATDGSADSSFDPGANSPVFALAIQPDGKILAGGAFTTLGGGGLGGSPRAGVGRLTATAPAFETLHVTTVGTIAQWTRSGTGPDFSRVTIERSSDGTTFTPLGNASPVSDGWSLGGLSFTPNQNAFIRARGYFTPNVGGATSIVESVRQVYVACPSVSTTVPAATFSVSYSAVIDAPGAISPSFAFTGTLPAGLTLSGIGVLSGTPAQLGTFNLSVTVTDTLSGCSSPSTAVAVTVGCPAIAIPTPIPQGLVGAAYPSTALAATGGAGPYTYSVTAGALPAGLTLSSAGALSGTPVTAGVFSFTVTATNSVGCSGARAFILVVYPDAMTNTHTLTASDGGPGTGFGSTVLISDDARTAVVGAANSGYVLTRSGTTWSEQAKLTPADSIAWLAISEDGNTVAGSKADLTIAGEPNRGVVYVFSRAGATWTEQARLVAADGAAHDYFGTSVELTADGNTLLIGARQVNFSGISKSGKAYVYTRSGATWSLQSVLTAADPQIGSSFGEAVAIAGDTALVTAPSADAEEPFAGASYVFTRSGTTWTQQAKLLRGDAINEGGFVYGFAAALSADGNTAAVSNDGATVNGNSSQGKVYVWTRTGTTWTVQASLVAPDGGADGLFGWSTRMHGETVIAGAPGTAVSGVPTVGAVYEFVRNGTTWSPRARVDNPGTTTFFGATTDVAQDVLLVGAGGQQVGANANQGVVYVYQLTPQLNSTAPASGSTNGGDAMTIIAPNVASGATFTLGGTALQNVSLDNGMARVTATTPPHAPGTFPIVLTNPSGLTATLPNAFTYSCPAIAVGPSSLPGATAGAAYGQSITQSGSTASTTFAMTGGALPAGLTLSSAGAITGSPSVTGSFSFTVTATDANTCTGSRAFTLAVGCPSIAVSPATLAGATAGVPYASTALSQTGGVGSSTFAVTSGALPSGMTLSSAGILTGTPTVTGTFTFSVSATDANACVGSRAYTIAVACPAITVSPTTLTAGTPGVAYPATALTQSGGVGASTFAVTSGALPSGMTLSTAGVLSGTPAGPGTFTFGVTATDANACGGTRTYTLPIGCAALAVTTSAIAPATLGRPYTATIATTGFIGTPQFSVTSGSLPSGMSLSSDGVLSGSPAQLGRFPFTATAADSTTCAAAREYAVDVNSLPLMFTGADAGGVPLVRSFAVDGTAGPGAAASFVAYDPSFGGGVRVAQGDVTGDGTPDVITAQGPGGAVVRVVSGATGAIARSFAAYDWTPVDGVYVAAGDVNGDGVADVITGAGGSPPLVRVFDGRTGVLLRELLADIPSTTAGVRVAAGDVTGDGLADIVTGLGPGAPPIVKVFDAVTGAEARRFFAYDPAFPGGVYVAAGDVNGDGLADIVTGAGAGGGPHVRVWSGASGAELMGFFAYSDAFPGGVRVAAGDLNGDGRADIVTGAGPGGGPHVRIFDGATASEIGGFFPYPLGFTGGVFVAAAAPLNRMVIDIPAEGAIVTPPFTIAGWAYLDDPALDLRYAGVHAWAYPVSGVAPVFLCATTLGGFRPDVGTLFGGAAASAGFNMTAPALSPGVYDIVVFVFNPRSMTPTIRRIVRVVAR